MSAPGLSCIGAFFEAWDLFRAPALAGAIAGALLGFLGVYVVLRRLVFLTLAVSQAAGLGVTLSFLARVHLGGLGNGPVLLVLSAIASPFVGATILTTLAVLLVPLAHRHGASARHDTILGLIFLVSSAGALAVGTRIVEELHDVETLLFGSAVAVVPADFHLLAVVAGATLSLHAWWWRGFAAVTIDPQGAAVRGLPVRVLDWSLLLSLALAISICTRILGALPTFGFSVLPAIAAVRASSNLRRSLWLGATLGAMSGSLGYFFAFCFELPVGASQVLVASGFVGLVEVARRLTTFLSQR